MRHGACLARTDLPWTADAHQTSSPKRRAMAAVCADCPVLTRCAEFASRARMTGGFWAGTARDELLVARVQGPLASGDVGGAA
ncbi:WhiB family transcriptional regulator [Cellulomonas aerilata]